MKWKAGSGLPFSISKEEESVMASMVQTLANQANAQLSTGPRTPEGKARSSSNSTKEGFTGKSPVIGPDEDQLFAAYQAALLDDTHPEGALEEEFFQRLLIYGWNLRRARAAESRLLATVDLEDEVESARLIRVARYRRDLERSHDRALHELRHLQTQRAVLLQQHDSVIAEISSITPLAELARITTHTDPLIHAMNGPLRPPLLSLAVSREQARRDAAEHAAEHAAQNEPNPTAPSADQVAEAIQDGRLSAEEMTALLDLYTCPPPVAALGNHRQTRPL
jgi:hypothetical protein